jgi:hypothetical protein
VLTLNLGFFTHEPRGKPPGFDIWEILITVEKEMPFNKQLAKRWNMNIIITALKSTKGEQMKKVILALFAVLTLAACTGSYKSGNCEYDFLLHKDISISKWIGNATGGC